VSPQQDQKIKSNAQTIQEISIYKFPCNNYKDTKEPTAKFLPLGSFSVLDNRTVVNNFADLVGLHLPKCHHLRLLLVLQDCPEKGENEL